MLPKDTAVSALQAFLKIVNAPVTRRTASQTLARHPFHPSLLAVSDCLTKWKISNKSVRVEGHQLENVPTPFLTQLAVENGLFIVVDSISGGVVRWWHAQRGWQRESVELFREKWSAVVLLAEVSNQSGERDYRTKHRQEQLARWLNPLITSGLLLILLLILTVRLPYFVETVTWSWLGLLLTKLMGVGVSVTLLSRQFGSSNTPSALCHFHQVVDCDAVLTSRAATLWAGLSWSEVGFFYFAGGVLAWLIGITNPFVQTVLWTLSLLALPYVLFSVYYQARTVGKWCTWCLLVQALLLTEAALLSMNNPLWVWSWSGAAVMSLAFLPPIIGWALLRPLLGDRQQKHPLMDQLDRFRNDPRIFKLLLEQQELMHPLPEGLETITLGNPQAAHSITLIINPFCRPCANAFADAESLVNDYEAINCHILLAISAEEADPIARFANHIYAIPVDQRSKALASWFAAKDRDFAKWSRNFPASETDADAQLQVHLQRQWNASAAITATPAIYVNTKKLPVSYQLSDLPYLIKYGLSGHPLMKRSTQRITQSQASLAAF